MARSGSIDLDNLSIEDTYITEEMAPYIDKEDYKYYYVDPKVKAPEMMQYYAPPESIIRIQHSKKIVERLIFPEEGPYSEKEEEKYEEFLDYLEEIDETLPESMTKRRTMRFLVGNHFKIKNTYKNILKTLEWRDGIRPLIVSDDMKLLLDHGYMYLHGRDRHFRPICCSNTKMLTELDFDLDE